MPRHDSLKKQWGDALLTLCEAMDLSLPATEMARRSGAPLKVAGRIVYALRNRGLIEPGKSTFVPLTTSGAYHRVTAWKVTDAGRDRAVEFAVQQGYIDQADAA